MVKVIAWLGLVFLTQNVGFALKPSQHFLQRKANNKEERSGPVLVEDNVEQCQQPRC